MPSQFKVLRWSSEGILKTFRSLSKVCLGRAVVISRITQAITSTPMYTGNPESRRNLGRCTDLQYIIQGNTHFTSYHTNCNQNGLQARVQSTSTPQLTSHPPNLTHLLAAHTLHAPFRPFLAIATTFLNVPNGNTSAIRLAPENSMTSLSTPQPQPPVGGMPHSSASM